MLGALLLAIALGALHALEPGHGKTLLAVSLVGARATPRQAVILAVALTVAHTAGVLALGFVVLAATRWIVPEQIYPWITLASGLFVTVLGARAVAREVRKRLPVGARARARPSARAPARARITCTRPAITITATTITPSSTTSRTPARTRFPGRRR